MKICVLNKKSFLFDLLLDHLTLSHLSPAVSKNIYIFSRKRGYDVAYLGDEKNLSSYNVGMKSKIFAFAIEFKMIETQRKTPE